MKMVKKMNNILKRIKHSELTRRIIKMIIFGIGGAAFSKGIMMLINIIVARLVSEEDYGIYSLMNNTIQTFTLFASAGIGVTLTRYVAIYKEKDKGLAGILIKTLSIFNLITSCIIAIIILVFSDKLSMILSKEVNVSAFLRITAFSVFFTSVSLLWQCVLQGFEKFKEIAIVQIINNVFIFFVSIIITQIYKIYGAIISLLILQILNYITMYWISSKTVKNNNIQLKLKFNNVIKESIIKYALPAFLSSIFVIPLLWFTNITFTKVHRL